MQIESERSSEGVLIDSRTPQPPSCVVFVQKAQRLGEVDSDVEEKLKQAAEIVRERGRDRDVEEKLKVRGRGRNSAVEEKLKVQGRGRNRDVGESGVSSVVKAPGQKVAGSSPGSSGWIIFFCWVSFFVLTLISVSVPTPCSRSSL